MLEAHAYPVNSEWPFDVVYPDMDEDGYMTVGWWGLQNMGRKNKLHVRRLEQPLVPQNIPWLQLAKVGFRTDFFQKDYRNATKGDNDQGEGTGYKLKGGNEELGRYNIQSTAFAFKGWQTPLSARKNFTPWKTKDFDKIMTDRTAVIGESHG